MTKYKIKPEADSFRPTNIWWRVYIRKYHLFFIPYWDWTATFNSKEDAMKCVETLIDAGEAIYLP